MRTLFTLCFVLAMCCCYAQSTFDIGFQKDTVRYSRNPKSQKIEVIPLRAKHYADSNLAAYRLHISVDHEHSSFPASAYKIDFDPLKFSELKEINNIYIYIKPDSLPDRQRQLILKLNIVDSSGNSVNERNEADHPKIVIVFDSISPESSLKGYEYLAYIGTNFDLVEGARPENLFFASNIFYPPGKSTAPVGFYLSLYGNRAMTQTDSNSYRVSTYNQQLNDTTYASITGRSRMVNSRTSDNIGAYISPLFRLGFKNPSANLKLYYAPSCEFVWRRTTLHVQYGETVNDTIVLPGTIMSESAPYYQNTTIKYNEYSFNLGIVGLFLVLENKQISVRVHGSVGYCSNYYRSPNQNQLSIETQPDIFFSGRAWITEPVTGITLQAEVTNNLFNARPFFVATLSKAIGFREIGSIFKPVTSR